MIALESYGFLSLKLISIKGYLQLSVEGNNEFSASYTLGTDMWHFSSWGGEKECITELPNLPARLLGSEIKKCILV